EERQDIFDLRRGMKCSPWLHPHGRHGEEADDARGPARALRLEVLGRDASEAWVAGRRVRPIREEGAPQEHAAEVRNGHEGHFIAERLRGQQPKLTLERSDAVGETGPSVVERSRTVRARLELHEPPV